MKDFQIYYNEPMEIKDLVASNVRKYRLAREFTQRELAEKCGVTSHHIEDIEAARRKPSLDLLFTLASRLGIDGAALLEQPDKPAAPLVKPLPFKNVLGMYSKIPEKYVKELSQFEEGHEVWELIEGVIDGVKNAEKTMKG